MKFANAKVEKLIRKGSQDQRVSLKATLLLNSFLSRVADDVASVAVELVRINPQRKTIRDGEVRIAFERYL